MTTIVSNLHKQATQFHSQIQIDTDTHIKHTFRKLENVNALGRTTSALTEKCKRMSTHYQDATIAKLYLKDDPR